MTPDKLSVYEEPAKRYEGVLFKGETFVVKKLSKSGKYAHGKANGNVDKMGVGHRLVALALSARRHPPRRAARLGGVTCRGHDHPRLGMVVSPQPMSS